MFTVTPYGAVRTVTGSMHLAAAGDTRLLLDCGLFQGHRDEADRINRHLPFGAASVDAVVLSHAHLDHCGALPTLVRSGFSGPVYCTAATRELAALVLRDSAKVQRQDIDFLNRHLPPGRPAAVPLYTDDDVERTLGHLRAVPYGEPWAIGAFRATLLDAGHILGSAITVLEAESKTVVFTGDLGRPGTPILRDPAIPPGADLLLMESTYGDRTHEPPTEGARQLGRIVADTASRRGTVLVPSFAIGRTQDLTYALHRLTREGAVPSLPVFVDSPMATDATDIFRRHPECFDRETRAFLTHDDPFGFRRLRYLRSVDDSKAVNDLAGPFVVIATSGMCESGRILHHLRHRLGDPRSTLVLVSYQAPHTLGSRLAAGMSPVNVFGEPHAVRLTVRSLDSFSAHADANELAAWLRRIPSVGRVYLVHGDEDRAAALAARLRGLGYRADLPERGAPLTV